MTIDRTFHQPATLDEAIALLQEHGDEARLVAGSTAVSIMLGEGLITPRALVSIARVPGLSGIEKVDDRLEIGATTTHRQVELSPVVREALPVLAETFGMVANVRVRNVATVGGVLAEADYASDPPALLLALDASIVAHGPHGERTMPLARFFKGFYETDLAPNEVLTSIHVPLLPPGSGATYEKFVTRSSEDRPCVGVAAIVGLAGDGTVAAMRVAVAAAAETPQRFDDLEANVRGTQLNEEGVRELAAGYAARIDTLDDLRGSARYRKRMVAVWIRRAVASAAARASFPA